MPAKRHGGGREEGRPGKGREAQGCKALAARWSLFIVGEENPLKLIQCDLSPEAC